MKSRGLLLVVSLLLAPLLVFKVSANSVNLGTAGSTSTVPEPGTLGLLGTGLVLGGAVRRKLRP